MIATRRPSPAAALTLLFAVLGQCHQAVLVVELVVSL
jgi:hypothetical protein